VCVIVYAWNCTVLTVFPFVDFWTQRTWLHSTLARTKVNVCCHDVNIETIENSLFFTVSIF
jgi:hypothetical protein